MEKNKTELRSLATKAIQAACLASKQILEVYSSDYTIEYKDDQSPLTTADKAAHLAIVSILDATGIPVFSEEGKNIPYTTRSSYDVFWLVDPLDGTKEFIRRNGEFTVNIALMEFNKPVIGVIAQPVINKIWCGIPGDGFYSGTMDAPEKIFDKYAVVERMDPGKTRVLASRSHRSPETEDFIEDLKRNSQVEVVSAGSALKFCLLAEGKADVYPRFAPTMEWDTAAGHGILLSVGKNILSYPANETLTYNKPKPVNDWFIAR